MRVLPLMALGHLALTLSLKGREDEFSLSHSLGEGWGGVAQGHEGWRNVCNRSAAFP